MEQSSPRDYPQHIAQFVSIAFHPLLMPLYATWLLLHSGSYLSYTLPAGLQQFLYIVIFVSTFLIPAMTTWLMWQKRWISSLELQERQERHLPFLFSLVCYVASVYLLFKLPVSRLFALTVMAGALAILMTFLINLRWKISAHMVGIGGLMGIFYGYSRYFHFKSVWILVAIAAVAGLIASARLYRGAHRPAEVYVGFVAGFITELWFIGLVAEFLVN